MTSTPLILEDEAHARLREAVERRRKAGEAHARHQFPTPFDEAMRDEMEFATVADIRLADLEAILSELDARTRERDGYRHHLDGCEQVAGKALGYPWFKDDPKNFPDATEANGVCIGEHFGDTIVEELANRLQSAEALLKEAGQVLAMLNDIAGRLDGQIPVTRAYLVNNGIDPHFADVLLSHYAEFSRDLRAAANLHARIVEQGPSAQSQPCGAREPISRAAGEAEPSAAWRPIVTAPDHFDETYFLVRPRDLHPARGVPFVPTVATRLGGELFSPNNHLDPLKWNKGGDIQEGPTTSLHEADLEWCPLP